VAGRGARGEVQEGRDFWDGWLRSLGATAASMPVGDVVGIGEDIPSTRAAGVGGGSGREEDGARGGEEDEGDSVQVGEMGPQEMVDADRQVLLNFPPQLLEDWLMPSPRTRGLIDAYRQLLPCFLFPLTQGWMDAHPHRLSTLPSLKD